jgi:hypothetical protein
VTLARWLVPVLVLLGSAAALGQRGADGLARAIAYEAEVAGLEHTGGDHEVEGVRLRSMWMLGGAGMLLLLGGTITVRAGRGAKEPRPQNL